MTPIAAPPRLFARALHEALDGALSPDRVAEVIATSLTRAQLADVPEEFGAFQLYVQGPLHATLLAIAGAATTETCVDRLSHVLWMASSTLRGRAAAPSDLAVAFEPREDRDDSSGLRTVEVPAQSPSAARASASSASTPSAEPRRSPTLGRISVTPMRSPNREGGVREVNESRGTARGPVLVVSLDPMLARDLEVELGARRVIVRVGSSAELVRQMTALRAHGYSVLIDAAMPSVDLGTFAGFSTVLPPKTRVVLWGSDERQKRRLVSVFPQASDWVASNDAATPGSLLLSDRDSTPPR